MLENGTDNWSVTVRPLQRQCGPRYFPEEEADVYFDDDLGTSRSPGFQTINTVRIEFDCPIALRGLRRFLTSGAHIADPLSAGRPPEDRESIDFYT